MSVRRNYFHAFKLLDSCCMDPHRGGALLLACTNRFQSKDLIKTEPKFFIFAISSDILSKFIFVSPPHPLEHVPLRRSAKIKSFPPSGPVINAAYSSAAASHSTQSTADAEAVSMATADCCISPTAWSRGLGPLPLRGPGVAVVTRSPWQPDTTAAGRGTMCVCRLDSET